MALSQLLAPTTSDSLRPLPPLRIFGERIRGHDYISRRAVCAGKALVGSILTQLNDLHS